MVKVDTEALCTLTGLIESMIERGDIGIAEPLTEWININLLRGTEYYLRINKTAIPKKCEIHIFKPSEFALKQHFDKVSP